jgi:hypothetical protein
LNSLIGSHYTIPQPSSHDNSFFLRTKPRASTRVPGAAVPAQLEGRNGVGPIYEKAYFVTAMNVDAEVKDETWELAIQTRDGEFVAQYSPKGLETVAW